MLIGLKIDLQLVCTNCESLLISLKRNSKLHVQSLITFLALIPAVV